MNFNLTISIPEQPNMHINKHQQHFAQSGIPSLVFPSANSGDCPKPSRILQHENSATTLKQTATRFKQPNEDTSAGLQTATTIHNRSQNPNTISSQSKHQATQQDYVQDQISSSFKQGRPVVRFPGEEWKRLVDREERLTLVGKFGNDTKKLEFVRRKFRSACPIDGSVQIGSLDSRTLLIRFSLEDDCSRALARGQLNFEGVSVRLFRWDPNWRSKTTSPMAPIWIELPNFPFHLFDADSIARICQPLGRFIALDAATMNRSRPSAAKAKLEVDISKPLIDKVWMEIEGLEYGFWQRIVFDRVPKFCTFCSRKGHMQSDCRKRGKSVEMVVGTPGLKDAPLVERLSGSPVKDDPLTDLATPSPAVEAVTEVENELAQADCRKRKKLVASEARVPAMSPSVAPADVMLAEEAPVDAVGVETPVVEETNSTATEVEGRKTLEPSGIGPKTFDHAGGPLTSAGLQASRPNGIYSSHSKQFGLVGPAVKPLAQPNLKWQRKVNTPQAIVQLNAHTVEGSDNSSNTTASQSFSLQKFASLNTENLDANSISAFKTWRTQLLRCYASLNLGTT